MNFTSTMCMSIIDLIIKSGFKRVKEPIEKIRAKNYRITFLDSSLQAQMHSTEEVTS